MTGGEPRPSRGFRASVVMREVILWLGSAVGVLCLVVAGAAVFFGVTPLVFRTGSMSPQIPTGALALAKHTPAVDLHVGDVVSVIRADGDRVTHRLVAEKPVGGGYYELTVKGDANNAADPDPIRTNTADRVFWSTPALGYVLSTITKPQYVLPVGALFGILLVLGFRPPVDVRRLEREIDALERELAGTPPRGSHRDDDGEQAGDGNDTDDTDHRGGPPDGIADDDDLGMLVRGLTPTTGDRQTGSGRSGRDRSGVTRSLAAAPAPSRHSTITRGWIGRRTTATSLAGVLVAAALLTTMHPVGTLAAFTDTASNATASFTTTSLTLDTIRTPLVMTCIQGSNQVNLAWTVRPGWAPTSQQLNVTKTVILTGAVSTSTIVIDASTTSLANATSSLGLTLGSWYDFTVQSVSTTGSPATTTLSAASTTVTVTVPLLSLNVTCGKN